MSIKSRRSLKASSSGIHRANRAVVMFATKIDLAAEVEISRATVQNFFAGKPVGRENFHKICNTLKLPWGEVADLADEPDLGVSNLNLQTDLQTDDADSFKIVSELPCFPLDCMPVDCMPANPPDLNPAFQLRQHLRSQIEQRCASVRVLDMAQPMPLQQVYIQTNLQVRSNRHRRLSRAELNSVWFGTSGTDWIDLGAQDTVSASSVISQSEKLLILGKPGSGKTTLLKQIALDCIEGNLHPDSVPLFISLKDFCTEDTDEHLLTHLINLYAGHQPTIAQLIRSILHEGQALVLLDGLDEVHPSQKNHVLAQVRRFVARFHSNRFVITCRTAEGYTLEQFTETTIADFRVEEISSFVTRWFSKTPMLGTQLLQELERNSAVRELATSPLLLTLVCIIFEDLEAFPTPISDLYREAANVLLREWDAQRQIDRSSDEELTVQQKEYLVGQIALHSFEQGQYFFEQSELQQWIENDIRDWRTYFGTYLDSETILKSIESQHGLLTERARGIYSFSHRTLHQYFAACAIAQDPDQLETTLSNLSDRLLDPCWQEVVLLTLELLPQPERLLQYLQRLLEEGVSQSAVVSEQSLALNPPVRALEMVKTPVRTFYRDLPH
ncbi:NACHT domain-containing protein [Leptolyngbya sp. AN03gr2]|uniref:NACHT domain-containing protein n=1 Tax=unclassified Leptolyngbya TaxID=2650499 RepID=UPI003D30F85C